MIKGHGLTLAKHQVLTKSACSPSSATAGQRGEKFNEGFMS